MGVNEDIPISKYISIKDTILYLAKQFAFLDANFENELIKKMYIDIVSLISLYEKIDHDDLIRKYYIFFKEENPQSQNSFEDFKSYVVSVNKENKLRVVALLNTKLYYFDTLIWEHATFSKRIVKYLFSTGYKDIKDTHEFLLLYNLKNIAASQSAMKCDFVVQEENLFVDYSQQDLKYLQDVKAKKDSFELDQTVERLIEAKHNIKFFRNMDDEDIRAIVKNVKFVQYKPHETIIKEGDNDDVIYFILNGECRVSVGKHNVGLLSNHQIFGEFAAITKEVRSATIRTNKATTVIAFQLALEAFSENPYSFAFLYKNVTNELIKKIDLSNKKKY
jgi:hypothetical protein